MQNRMKQNQLDNAQIEKLLNRTKVGTLGTVNADNSPYTIPVHFVYFKNKIYIHSLPKGKKLDNIKINEKISFSVYEMDCLLLDENEKPCDTNTKYESVVISGNGKIVDDLNLKKTILKKVVEKYAPNLVKKEIAENMIKGTAVTEIEIKDITGKFYK